METIELVVYIMVAFAVGALVLAFLFGFDFVNVQQSVVSLLKEDSHAGFEVVTNDTFTGKMISLQKACAQTDKKRNVTMYLKKGDVDQEMFFDVVKKLSLCKSFQSSTYDCGTGEFFVRFDDLAEEDIFMVTCRGPRIFNVSVIS